ncbi:MAG: hypothetical protein AAGF97_07515 [Planctomycetota bacterium]
MLTKLLSSVRSARDSKSSRLDTTCDFSLETLEERRMLAGNVDVMVRGDNVTLRGDNDANELTITETGGMYIISGDNGTTLSGDLEPISSINNLRLIMRDGADIININTDVDVGGNLNVNTGRGEDMIKGTGKVTVGGNLAANLGTENDTLDSTIKVGRNARVVGGRGEDTITLKVDEVGGSLNVSGGADNDTIMVTGDAAGMKKVVRNVSINTSSGNDTAYLTDLTIDGNSRFSTGSGIDIGHIDEVAANGNVRVATGTGTDTLNVGMASAAGALKLDGRSFNVNMGGDNDTLNVKTTSISTLSTFARLSLQGGGGDGDQITGTGVTSQTELGTNLEALFPSASTRVTGFETVA